MRKLLLFTILFPALASGQLKLAKIFSSDMVIQRDRPIHIWGTAVPGKSITVIVASGKLTAITKKDSSWSVSFPARKAALKGIPITVSSGKEKIVLQNVLFGDIWVCSGQSNMEWPLQKEMHFKDEVNQTNQPLIRLLNPPPAGRYVYGVPYTDSLTKRLNKNDFYDWDGWKSCDSNTVKPMSAIAYYFAKSIVTNEKIPVGIINLSIGGAPLETFISTDALQKSPQFAKKVNGNWLDNPSLPEWIRERGRQNLGDVPVIYKDEYGPNHAYKPGMAYDAGIAPILPFAVKGVLWYQGESNSLEADRVKEYRALLHLLIDDYRKKWKQPEMPFYWVQLSSIDTTNYKSHYWPEFRDEQRKLLEEVKNGGMAVCSDIGFRKDVHPTNKKDVGERLARWALNKVYGQNIEPSGPLPLTAEFKDDRVTINFQYTTGGLQTVDGKPLKGFSTDKEENVTSMMSGNQLIIFVKEKPTYIYYGWEPFSTANLVNAALLPASTFKIEVK